MSRIDVIHVHTPYDVDALQALTGLEVRIDKAGAFLSEKSFGSLLLDEYEQVERDSRLSDCGQLGDAA